MTSVQNDGKTLQITISGTLGNDVHKEFRESYENKSPSSYIIDLGGANNIDSSGLGMLLLLRDFAGGEDADIRIINCSKTVLDIFNVTCFFQLFNIPEHKGPAVRAKT